LIGHFSLIVPPFADRGLSRHLTWSASADERGNQSGVNTISLGRLQYIRRGTAGPQKEEEEFIYMSIFILQVTLIFISLYSVLRGYFL
jgi:hypothetical protein